LFPELAAIRVWMTTGQEIWKVPVKVLFPLALSAILAAVKTHKK
jgi:hypothetical protein